MTDNQELPGKKFIQAVIDLQVRIKELQDRGDPRSQEMARGLQEMIDRKTGR